MLNEGVHRFRFLSRSVAPTFCRAARCGGSSRSISRPASTSLLTNPEMPRIDSMAARIRNRRLLADSTAPSAMITTVMLKATPVPVTCWRSAPGHKPRSVFHQGMS